MKKRLRFFYRYLTTPNRWRRLFNAQNLLVLIVAAVFLAGMIWTKPPALMRAANAATPTPGAGTETPSVSTATPGVLNPTPGKGTKTPLPPEYLANADQTIGITLAGAMLVLIVVAGVLMFLPTDARRK